MDIDKIKFHANNLVELRKKINEQEEITRELKEQKDCEQSSVLNGLKEMELGSIGTKDGTKITRAVKKTMKIVNEKELMRELKDKGLNDYVTEQIDKNLFKGLSSQLVKDNKVFAGTEIKETEYISITNKSKKK